jgi:GTP cyclohydrolase I
MIDRAAAEQAIAAFLRALGHDPTTDPELRDTPARVTAAFADELLSGYLVDPAELVRQGTCATEAGVAGDLVTVRGLFVATTCPHHLLPAVGTATVAYLPGACCLGVGTIARLVDAFARRLTLQETVARAVVDALMQLAGARGAYCHLDLVHTCLTCRGAREPNARVGVTARAGELEGAPLAGLERIGP